MTSPACAGAKGAGGESLRSHLFLLCGLPFSGKSTMGRALSEQLGIVHVEVDRQHTGLVDNALGRRVERHEWIAAYQAAYREVEAALNAGRNVVFDAVSYRRVQRDRIRRIADAHGASMTIIYLDVSEEQARARLVANRSLPARVDVHDDDFAEVVAGMQPPMPDEPNVRYRPEQPLAQWIDTKIAPIVKEESR